MDNKTAFLDWLKNAMHRRPNTVRMYAHHLKKLPDLTLDASTETICGQINTTLTQHPSKEAKGAYKAYVDFLFSEYSKTNPTPEEFERMRIKKNSILANIELPKEVQKYDLDIEKFYISKKKLLNALKTLENPYRKGVILLYDSGVRINELLKNDWKNLTATEIYVPRQISKTNRDRIVEWLMPESKEIVEQHKTTGKIQDWLGKYHAFWEALSPKRLGDYAFNPHALRHTILSDLAGMGWEIGALQRRAGHVNINETQKYISWAGHKEERTILNEWCEKHTINLKELLDKNGQKT